MGYGSSYRILHRNRCTVCIPITDSQQYDLIIDNGTLSRVQVRTTVTASDYGIYIVNLRTCGGKYGLTRKVFESGTFDLLFIVTEKENRYLIPAIEITSKTAMSLGKDKDKYKV